jgi:D-alanyl-D-alanine carboxypeptidase/D-alanyl-D-alanine-endopeptidase (penicillin-binding protein 4)
VINGNVYLRGRGDPKLVPEEMAKLVTTARSTGATAINGDLVLDRSFFADTQDNSYTIDGETQRAYNVNPDALLYAFKTLVHDHARRRRPHRRRGRHAGAGAIACG